MNEETERLALSVNQESVWIAWQRDPEVLSHIIPLPFVVQGTLDVARLRRAVEVIGSRFPQLTGRVVGGADGSALEWSDAAPIPVTEIETAWDGDLDAVLRGRWRKPFDLRRGPLLRIDVLRGGPSEILLVTGHHVVNDGASVLVMMEALGAAYTADPDADATQADLSPSRRHAARSRELADGDAGLPHRAYWRAVLGDGGPDFALPPSTEPGRYTMLSEALPRELEIGLRACAKAQGVSYVTVLLSAFFALLRRYSGSDDLLAFTPFHGRTTPDLAEQLGYFVNLLPIRQRVRASDRYRDLMSRVRVQVKDALQFAELPLPGIMHAAGLTGPQAQARTHQALFQYWHAGLRSGADLQSLEFGDATLRLLDIESSAGFKLAVMVREDSSGTHVLWKDPEGAVGPAQMRAMASDYLDVLAEIVDDPGAAVIAPLVASAHAAPASESASSAPAVPGQPESEFEPESGEAGDRAAMVEVWREVLGIPDLGWQDSFFELGGHSLLAESLIEAVEDRFGTEVSIRTLFDHPRLSDFTEQVLGTSRVGASESRKPEQPPVRHGEAEAEAQWRPVPYRMALSLSRENWPDGVIASENIICKVFEFPDVRLDTARLERAVRWAVAVSPSLSAEYRLDASDGPVYRTRPPRPGLVDVVRPAARGWDAVRDTAAEIAGEEIARPLDVREGRAVHVVCVQGAGAGAALVIRVDHTVCDGLSYNRFLSDVSDAYAAEDEAEFRAAHTRPELVEVAEAERRALGAAGTEGLRAAWRARLPRGIPQMFINEATPWSECPPDGGTLHLTLSGEAYERHLREAKRRQVSGFMVAAAKILSAVRPLLLNDDLGFFCPFSGRFVPEAATTVGNFVNVLPVVVDAPREADLPTTLDAVRDAMLWTLQHQGLPFTTVLDEVRDVDTSDGRYPMQRRSLFMSGSEPHEFKLDTAVGHQDIPDVTSAMFDLSVWIADTGAELTCSAVYRTSLLDAETVHTLLAAAGRPLEPAADRGV